MTHSRIIILCVLLFSLVAGCNASARQNIANAPVVTEPAVILSATTAAVAPSISPTHRIMPTLVATPPVSPPDNLSPSAAPAQAAVQATTPTAATATARPTLGPDDWKNLPVVPEVSQTVKDIYQIGQNMGNNAHAFSKVGDCGSTPAWFLGDFDRGSKYYRLGEHTNLQAIIDYYGGSFDRTSLAARSGFNASALWVPLWADRTYCNSNEAPLACEYRVHRPAIAFIMLGTNDVWKPEEFEPQMRKIIEYSIGSGIIPILSTKADNQEKDYRINATIARLAVEYDIPLWNFWAAANNLPEGGLQEDAAHLTWGRNFFDDPEAMTKAWPVRNLTALQVLNAVWQKIQ